MWVRYSDNVSGVAESILGQFRVFSAGLVLAVLCAIHFRLVYCMGTA